MFVGVAVCAIIAALMYSDQPVRETIEAVLVMNLIGLIVGLVITHVFGFPRDGSYRLPPADFDPAEPEKFDDSLPAEID